MASKQLLQLVDQFEAGLIKYSALTTAHLLGICLYAAGNLSWFLRLMVLRWLWLLPKASSSLWIVRSTRAILENLTVTELIKLGPDPMQNLADFVEYAYVDQENLKRLNGYTANITPQDLAAVAKFTDPGTGKVFKHWSKVNRVEERAQRVGHKATYDSFYRIASLATHGAAAFALMCQDVKGLVAMREGCLSLAVGMTYGIVDNCHRVCGIADPTLSSLKMGLKNIKDQIII